MNKWLEHLNQNDILMFRDEVLDTKQQVCTERALYYTEAQKINAHQPVPIRRALCLKNILENMTIYIEDKTLLAGNQASCNRAAPIFIECATDWLLEELDAIEQRDGDAFIVPEEEKKIIRNLSLYWTNRTLKDRALAIFPDETKLNYDLGIIKSEGNITAGDAHIAVNYEKLIKNGLTYYINETIKKTKELDLSDQKQLQKSMFYRAVLIVLNAAIKFSHRYSHLAHEMSLKEPNAKRKRELQEISRVCRKVPEKPADSMYEALQSIWIIHVILQIESSGHSLSYGRLDQYLINLYEADLRKKRITREAALIFFENLWIKSLTINKIRSYAQSRYNAGSPMYQNVTIGGQTINAKDAVNELSYIILESVKNMHLTQPNLTVRYHRNISSHFMQSCIDVMRCGFGMPAFNSDEVIIPALLKLGVAKEDAYNYSAIGCVEVAVPGKWGLRVAGMSFINMPRVLLTAMNNGIDLDTNTQICPGFGHFLDMESFDELFAAWDKTIRFFTKQSVILDTCADTILEQDIPDILCAALVDDCIERGLNLKEGGAVYDCISGLQVGMANLADSLAAIKKLVYDSSCISRTQLWNAIKTDFNTIEGKQVQQILIHQAPKYGNDIDEVDYLVVKAYDSYIDEIKKFHNTRYKRGPIGGQYMPGTSTVAANVALGINTPATPDGRNAYEPLAEGCSPSHGNDTSGPTAVFKTLSKLKQVDMAGGVLLNQKINPQLLETDHNRKKLELLIRTYFDQLDGFHVQYNIVSKDVLLDAQLHPEKHRDLVVRVAGYSAFFNILSRQTQNDIIARTEQKL